ncbi:MAG TPA: Na+/H+ antiporter subunit E [Ferrovibrio sp.]|jgi:multicomponent K+:H+ antiporter subunit E|uniref:Na+/H+ antiporter subunit E n=1 Tax=Ferrovibrio sp. TaxID=1917215 RepID=UPI002B4B3923|nr:Na+/H+ antiporter subunit E [Ferrovibrio sp.]HLT78874.1 Na+/H+ antiporter subunit E [Ferrovibrio sp.]
MTRWFAFPLLTAAFFLAWLLANESVTPGTILLGAALAIGIAPVLTTLNVPKTVFRRPLAALKLSLVVLVEIVRSNNAVARIILSSDKRPRRSGFVRIPLSTRNPYSLTALACIITATPGTLWVEYDSADNTMLLHVLDLIDEEEWVRIIKERYESRLMEIFT